MDLANPFSASSFATHIGLLHCPPTSSLRAINCLVFPTTLCEGCRDEGSNPQIENLSPIEGALCLPFSPSNCVTHC